jgi:hypothetical protein
MFPSIRVRRTCGAAMVGKGGQLAPPQTWFANVSHKLLCFFTRRPRALARSKNWLCSATRPPLRRKWLCFVSRSTVPRMALFCRRPPRSQNWLCFTRRPRERCYSVDCTPSRTSPGRERASLSRKIEQHEEQLSQDQQSTGDDGRIWCARPSHLCFPLLVVPSAQDPLK